MQRFVTSCVVMLAAVFLLSVVTIEPDYVQGYRASGLPVFVEKDAAHAICDGHTVLYDYLPCVAPFSRSEPVLPESRLHITSTLYRGPPLLPFSL